MKTLAKVGATSKLLVVGPQWCRSTICLQQMRHNGAREPIYRHDSVTPVAGSNFRPLSQTHISKREFKNGHISRFCSVFQVIQAISSAKIFSAEEVDLSFNSETKEHPQISNPSFWKRDRENVFSTNVLIRGEMNPLHKHKIMSVGYQVKQNLKYRS